MSSKKGGKKQAAGKKDKDKQKQKKQMEQQEARRQQQRIEAQQRIQVLQNSGILDAYEYFLRQICKNGLPEANIFQFAAQQILKYQKKMKTKQAKKQQLGFGTKVASLKPDLSPQTKVTQKMRSPPKQQKIQSTKKPKK